MNLKEFKNQFINSKRNQTADLLKGLAVIFMIQVHLIELFARQDIFSSNIGSVLLFFGGPPAAPLFMVVMGYYIAQSNKSFSHNFKRGILLFAGGILLNTGINLHLLLLVSQGNSQIDPLKLIFGADILPLAGLSIIIISLLKISFKKNLFFYLITAAVILYVHNITLNSNLSDNNLVFIQAFLWGNLGWSYFPLIPWLFYPLMGFMYSLFIKKVNLDQSYKDFFGLFTIVVTYITLNYGIEIAADLKDYYHHDWLYSFWVVQFLILMVYFSEKIEMLCGKSNLLIFIKWLGKNVTAVYVFQWIIIGNIATALYKTQNWIELILWFIVICFLVAVLIIAFEKLKVKIKTT